MIKIEGLNKFYNKGKNNEIHVINDVTLELPNSGLISFLGPSGSGKTTLLNVIGGLDKAKGSISYDALTLDKYSMHKIDQFRNKEIGYVFQNYNLLLEETVYSNLVIALEMIGIFDSVEQEKRIAYTLKAVGMYKYRKKRAYALSGGQQQRVSIARALVKQAKVIIADEPTGNLDSENTIEVMNILKKISQKSLVLVVTHNEEVANFYSDQVIRISDGQIADTYVNDGTQSLNTEQSNTIYLKDLNLTEEQGDLVRLKYYTTKEPKPLELRIIERNGTYFISSTEKIRLLEDTNLKVVDSKYQALKQEEVTQFDYDTSWFSSGSGKQNIFKRMLHAILESFNKMRYSKRRTKFLYLAFFTIGILLALCVMGFSNYYLIDDTNFQIDKRFDIVDTKGYYAPTENRLVTYSILDYVENVTSEERFNIRIEERVSFSEIMDYSANTTVISYKGSENLKLLAGRAPGKNEVVLSKKAADDMIEKLSKYYPTYDSLVGVRCSNWWPFYQISGVVDSSYSLVYMEDETYLNLICSPNYSDCNIRSYDIEQKYDTYEIIGGRDLTKEDQDTKHILVNHDLELLGQTVNYYGEEYEVVGVFEFKKYPSTSNFVIIKYSASYKQKYHLAEFSYAYKSYSIVEGVDASSPYDCLASVYSQYKVGDIVYVENQEYKVVGLYYSDSETMGAEVMFSREACILSQFYGNILFQTKDEKAVEDIIKPKSYYRINIYECYYNNLKEEQQSNFLIFGIFALVLLIIVAVFIYFIMRSRMIADIYPIGVYRSIGASRMKMILRFVSDILVMVTLTSLIGYLFAMFIFQTIAANVNDTLSMNALKSSYLFSFLGVVILYVMNLIFGLFPIVMLMRKTPAEIISKYDI